MTADTPQDIVEHALAGLDGRPTASIVLAVVDAPTCAGPTTP